jgi:hypothetical protein
MESQGTAGGKARDGGDSMGEPSRSFQRGPSCKGRLRHARGERAMGLLHAGMGQQQIGATEVWS